MTSDQLHQAFLNTSFKVLAKTEFIIKINTIISEVEGLNSWAFITAWNPSPEILNLEENRIRNIKNNISNIEELMDALALLKNDYEEKLKFYPEAVQVRQE